MVPKSPIDLNINLTFPISPKKNSNHLISIDLITIIMRFLQSVCTFQIVMKLYFFLLPLISLKLSQSSSQQGSSIPSVIDLIGFSWGCRQYFGLDGNLTKT